MEEPSSVLDKSLPLGMEKIGVEAIKERTRRSERLKWLSKTGLTRNYERSEKKIPRRENVVMEVKGYEVDKKVMSGLIKKAIGQVEGIHSIKRSLFGEGIKVKKAEEGLTISLDLLIREGGFVPQIVEETQKKVTEEIEKTLGTKVAKFDIKIRGIRSSP